MLLLILVAFVAGVVTALSPCVLPALPVVLAGSAGGGARRVGGIAVGFVASFVAFTLALTAALDAIGLSATALRNLAIAALILFGLTLVVPALGERVALALAPVGRLGDRIPRGRAGLGGGLLVGVALGLVWTPCAGPVFAAIAAVAATGDADGRAVVVLTAYAIGAVVPLCLIAMGGRRLLGRLRGRAAAAVRPTLGLLMVVAGVMIALGWDTRLTTALVRDAPAYTDTLQVLERSSSVQSELAGFSRPAADDIPPYLDAARGSRAGPGDDLGLPDAGAAPELRGITATFNTDPQTPLSIAGLRGRVVLVDFWTYSCINCLRTIPELESLYTRYRADGLTVVGVHTPEFRFEADRGNVASAVRDLGITYPVALDPEFATWDAFGTRYWPTTYLIDRRGHVRDLHVGEGDEQRTEAIIRRALAVPEGSPDAAGKAVAPPGVHSDLTPETYVGALRLARLAPGQSLSPNVGAIYRAPARLPADNVAFDGGWLVGDEGAQAGARAALELSFRAKGVYLVLDGDGARRVGRVLIDGHAPTAREAGSDVDADGRLVVTGPRLYRLLDLPATRSGRIRIELPSGTRAYAFTFG